MQAKESNGMNMWKLVLGLSTNFQAPKLEARTNNKALFLSDEAHYFSNLGQNK